MTVSANFGLLSSTSAQALSSMNTKSNLKVLSGIAGGFNSSSIFSNSSGLTGKYATTGGVSELTGTVAGRNSSIYSGSGFGTSLIGNYYNSISSVVVGQKAPTSIFEQRLAYSMGLRSVPETDYPTGNYSNLFSSSSVKSSSVSSSAKSSSTTYNVFNNPTKPAFDFSKASSANSLSDLMSKLNISA